MLRHRRSLSAFYLPAVCGLLCSSSLARANPTGAQVVNGAVGMETIGSTLKITAPDRSIIHWQNFSIGAGETTQFIQPGSMATVLNRVTSGEASHLMGTLQANGRVYLLNPNGIFIGNGAVVDVGSFMATTAHLTDEAFLKGVDFQLTGASDAPIRNAGTITARNGDVFLLAQVVENRGTIRAAQGSVGLMAGREFYVKKDEAGAVKVMVNASQVPGAKKGVGVDQRGTIEALRANLEADGNAYALAINQAGVVRATGVNQLADGTVTLSAPGGKISNNGQLIAANLNGSGGKISAAGTEVVFEAASLVTAAGAVDGGEVKIAAEGDSLISGGLSVDGATGKAGRIELTGDRLGLFDAKVTADGATGGGEVLVGGDYQGLNPLVQNASRTFVSKGSEISADATIAGDGGEVVVWSDNGTQFYGTISSQGGSVSGNGGFVEVSGKDYLDFRGTVNTLAANGQTGMLLLDPSDLFINNTTDANPAAPANPFAPDGAGASVLTWDTIDSALDTGNVTVTTGADAGTGTGLITINGTGLLTFLTTGRSLTITASDGTGGGSIVIGADITSTGGGSLIFTAPTQISIGAFTITTAGGAVTFNGATVLTGNAAIDTTNAGGTATGASVTFDGSIAGTSFDLTLAAGVSNIMVNGAVGSSSDELGDLRVVSANDVTFQDTLDIAAYIQDAGTGTTEFQANLETGAGFSFTGNELTFAAGSGNNVVGGDVSISNAGAFTLANGATLASAGIFEQNGTGLVILGGDVSSADAMTFGSDVTLTGAVELQNLGGNLQLLGAVDGGFDLSLSSAGNVTFGGAVGSNDQLGDLTIITANDVTFQSTLLIGAYIQQAGTGITEFQGNLETGLGFSFTGNELKFAAGSGNNVVGGDMTISNTGAFTLDVGATLASAGVFEQNGVGAVSLGGDVSSADAMTFGSDVTLTGVVELQNAAGNLELTSTVNGGFGLTITSAGTVTLGGAVGGGTALTSLNVTGDTIVFNGGEVTTEGAAGQVYTGAVTLGVATTLTTVGHDVTFTGGGSTLSGAQSLTIDAGAGAVTFGGAVGTGALTSLSSLTVTGDSIALNGGGVRTAGLQSYTGAVTLGDDTTLTTTDSDVTFTSTIRNTIAQTLTISAGTGTVTFAGAVGGGAAALQSLAVTGGTILMDGGALTTAGLQNYAGVVDLGADTILTTDGGDITFGAGITGPSRNLDMTTGAGDISVTGAVGSNTDVLGDLTIASNGTVTFNGTLDIGGFIQTGTGSTTFNANLETGLGFSFTGNELKFAAGSGNNVVGGDMTISNTGAFTLDVGATLASAGVFEQNGAGAVTLGGDVSSADAMTFGSDVTLTAAVVLQNAAGNLELQNTVAGGFGLTVTSAGTVRFGGAVGAIPLASLTVSGVGITIDTTAITTSGAQIFTGPVTLVKTTTLTAADSPVTFSGATTTISGAQALTIAAGTGTVTFGAAVGAGALTALTSLEVTGGTIAINGGDVETTGAQLYTGAVTLGDDTTLTTTDSDVTFNTSVSTIQNAVAQTLTIAAGTGTVTFGGAVGGGTALTSMDVTAATIELDGGAVTTQGAAGQIYGGAVSLGANTTLNAGAVNLVTFGGTVDGAQTLAISGTSNAQFDGVVGGTAALTALTVGGNTAINTTGITTAGIQTYTGAVDLQSSTTLNAGAGNLVTFSSTVNGASDLTIGGTSDVRFDGFVGSGMALTSLTVGGNTAINTATIRTAGNQTYTGAVSAGTVSFTAGSGGIDLGNAGNDFTGNVTIISANAITLRDANALSLAGAATTAGQVFVAGGNLRTAGAYAISGVGDMLLESEAGQVTLGAGTSYTGRNITVVAGENQSFINQAGSDPFIEMGGRTLVFSSKAKINSPSQLDGGFSGFQPYFNTVPEVVIGPALGTYSVLNSLPGGNLMVYRPPGSSPVHPDHVSQATVNSIVNTEAYQTAVPILGYSLFTVPRSTVEIRYRMSPDQGARATPYEFRPRLRESGRPSAEANRRPSNDMGRAESQGREAAPFRLGEISIQGPRVSLAPSSPADFIY